MYGEYVAFVQTLTALMFTYLLLKAIQYRRHPQRHSRYMISTGLLSIEPILERLLGFWVPGLMTDLEDVPLVWFITYACMMITCGLLIWSDKYSWQISLPFWLITIFVLFKMMVLYAFSSGTVWSYIYAFIKTISMTEMAFAAGATTSVLLILSWRYPKAK
jgi:hypothetical protein